MFALYESWLISILDAFALKNLVLFICLYDFFVLLYPNLILDNSEKII